jgi:hypothetical protein
MNENLHERRTDVTLATGGLFHDMVLRFCFNRLLLRTTWRLP